MSSDLEIIDLTTPSSWPADLIAYLEDRGTIFREWEESPSGITQARLGLVKEFDRAYEELREILSRHAVVGFHNTRLTYEEIQRIKDSGMQLPNLALLIERIEVLVKRGTVTQEVGERLKEKNQANDKHRANMIWFCLFEPHLAGESGIERLLRHWGGEALYNSHENDPITGPILRRIGIPVVVEAVLPIALLRGPSFMSEKVARQFHISQGFNSGEGVLMDDFVRAPLPAESIRAIYEFPGVEFRRLTDCDSWYEKLTYT